MTTVGGRNTGANPWQQKSTPKITQNKRTRVAGVTNISENIQRRIICLDMVFFREYLFCCVPVHFVPKSFSNHIPRETNQFNDLKVFLLTPSASPTLDSVLWTVGSEGELDGGRGGGNAPWQSRHCSSTKRH
jgi:hypothetical protein